MAGVDREGPAGATRTPPPQRELPAVAGLAALCVPAGLFTWWALDHGAYFGDAFYPGTALLALLAVVLLWAAPWPASLRRSRPVALVLVALAGLTAWTALSALWSPVPETAVRDAQRVLTYALAFGCGAWICLLLGRLRELSSAPLTLAAGVAGAVTAVRLITADGPAGLLELDGTLEYPLGYRNATAAFFLLAIWPALALASSPRMHVALRAPCVGVVSLCLAMGLLTQSRGAILATACSLIAFLALTPRRRAAAGWLALAVLAAAPLTPFASDLYRAVNEGLEPAAIRDAMRTAGIVTLACAALASLLAFAALRWAPAAPLVPSPGPGDRMRTLAIAGAALAAGAVLVVALAGNPVTWVGERVDEFRQGGQPDLSEQATRFSFSGSSNRSDLWRVALHAAADDPLRGDGAGGFEGRYLRERRHAVQYAQDAHNVWLELLAELGIPGLALFVTVVAGAAWALALARRRGPATALLVAGASGAGVYWLVHSSLDWFWAYPGVCAPVFALAGAASAPALIARMGPTGRAHRAARAGLGALVVLFAVSLIPPYLSERYVKRALADAESNPSRAYRDLDGAAELNPLSIEPLLTEGRIALRLGDPERALDAFRRAAEERPEDPVALYNLALLLAPSDREAALDVLERLRRVDPLSPQIDAAEARIEAAAAPPAGKEQEP